MLKATPLLKIPHSILDMSPLFKNIAEANKKEKIVLWSLKRPLQTLRNMVSVIDLIRILTLSLISSDFFAVSITVPNNFLNEPKLN